MKTYTITSDAGDFSLTLTSFQLANIINQGDIGPHVIRIANKVFPTFQQVERSEVTAICVELGISFTGLTLDQMVQSIVWASAWKIHTSPDLYVD